MNAIHFLPPTTAPERPAPIPTGATTIPVPAPVRHRHRERDFGVGYGNSSGYASHCRYSSHWATTHFKFA